MYSARLLDHFEHPRHAGDLPGADVTASVQNPACGDVLELFVKMEKGLISDVGFMARGCVPAMACGSAVTELIAGKSLAQASAITAADVASALDGLPPASDHAAQLAIEAVQAFLQTVQQSRS